MRSSKKIYSVLLRVIKVKNKLTARMRIKTARPMRIQTAVLSFPKVKVKPTAKIKRKIKKLTERMMLPSIAGVIFGLSVRLGLVSVPVGSAWGRLIETHVFLGNPTFFSYYFRMQHPFLLFQSTNL